MRGAKTMDERFSRSARIFGVENQEKLNNTKVLVFGLGGVGGAVCEALARSGVGTIGLVDKDTVDITNINRQLIATESTVGMKKTEASEKRLLEINPQIKLNKYDLFYLPETAEKINLSEYDYIVDSTKSAILLLNYAVILQDPNHESQDQPRFTLQILKSNHVNNSISITNTNICRRSSDNVHSYID